MIEKLTDVYDFIHDWIYLVINNKFMNDIEIIIGNQNVSSSDRRYIVIHEPPVSNRRVGETNRKSVRSVDLGRGNIVGRKTYTNTFQATISIEEVQGQDNLSLLEETIEDEDVVSFWRENNVSFMQMEAGTGNADLTGTIFEKRYIKDLVFLYTIERFHDEHYIETVEIQENYN